MSKFKKVILTLFVLIISCVILLESAHMTVQAGRCLAFISHNNWMYNDVVPAYINFKETIAEWLGIIE